ncbi:hypothetical protein B0A52_00425 [Exophiala mesophila]|uniref:Major facilitator superfamily (MFS) profile domain-containing protein n=1 Tax=Exophiala mesophila TaxID=212818 RepID=A0A438NK16_EXOME|nr:hypothetical protein B0A52_00425 [Exophiala mesophila]
MGSKDASGEVDYVQQLEASSVEKDNNEFVIDPALEKKTMRKVDRRILPIFLLLQLCAFIDRINIGNARIQGLEADLNMTGNDWNIVLFLFFIPYILLEAPSNVLLKRLRPSLFLPIICCGWSLVTTLQGVTASFAGLVVCRVLIGVFEAGLFPAQIYIMSTYYRRKELQWRVSFLFCGAIISGAFSGLLAYAIAHLDGVRGYSGWRWIFILEGIASFLIGILAFFLVPDWPDRAKFLNEEERNVVLQRVADDRKGATMSKWTKGTAKRIFGDVKIYLGIGMYMGIVVTSYAGSFFIPTILRQLGWTSIKAQVMSIPVWIFGMTCAFTSSFVADYLNHRFGIVLVGGLLTSIGYIILLNMHSVAVGVRYFAVFCCLGGGFVVQPTIIAWLSNNVSGSYKSGISSGMQLGFGNIGGIIASNIYLNSQAPEYPLGFGLGLGMVWFCIICATAFFFLIWRENRIRNAGGRDDRYSLPEEELNNLGDDHPTFRFTY